MKKFFYLMMAFAVTASTLTSCEDVPSPYDNPNNKKQEVTPSQASGSGTEADPYNVAALNAHLKSLQADVNTEEIFVKGKVVAIKELQTSGFGNATYYISDDGTTTGQLYIYRSLDLDNKKFTDANAIKVGDEVVIRGQFVNYKGNTPETVTNKSYLYSINGKKQHDSNPTPTPPTPAAEAVVISGNTLTLNNTTATAGTETLNVDLNAIGLTETSDLSNITLSDGSVLSFSANGQTTTPKFFAKSKGIRLYANNTFTLKGKKAIAKIVITCDVYQGTNYTGNTTATVSFTGNDATYTNTLVGAPKGGVQLRLQSISITYVQ